MTESQSNNPAGRLHAILKKAAQGSQSGKVITWKHWLTVFGVNSDDPSTIYPIITKMTRAAKEVERAVTKKLPGRTETFLRYQKTLYGIVSPMNLESPWDRYRTNISEPLLLNLEHADHALREFFVVPEFLERLPELKQQIAEIMEGIEQSDLPQNIKESLIQRLETLIQSIEDYQAYGIQDFERDIDAFSGVIATNYEIISSEKNKAWLNKAKDVLSTINGYVKVVSGAFQLYESTGKLIKNVADHFTK